LTDSYLAAAYALWNRNRIICESITVVVFGVADLRSPLIDQRILIIAVKARAVLSLTIAISILVSTGATALSLWAAKRESLTIDLHLCTAVTLGAGFSDTVSSAIEAVADRDAAILTAATVSIMLTGQTLNMALGDADKDGVGVGVVDWATLPLLWTAFVVIAGLSTYTEALRIRNTVAHQAISGALAGLSKEPRLQTCISSLLSSVWGVVIEGSVTTWG